MNPRERNLLIVLIAIVVGGVSLYAGVRFWLNPLQEYNRTIERMIEENAIVNKQLDDFNKERVKLTVARLKSLPANPELAAAEYMAYLQPVLDKSGMVVEEMSHAQPQKIKPVSAIPNIKEVGHQIMTFTVRARGDLKQLVKALDLMQKTPYEHRIRNLTIDRVEISQKKDASNRLSIQMIIETLLVAKTENKPGLPPGINPMLLISDEIVAAPLNINFGMVAAALQLKQTLPTLPESRDYALIGDKNIFVGAIPYEPKVFVKKKEKEEPEVEIAKGPEAPEENTPAYVYLTQTDPDQQTAYLRNRIYGGAERKLVVNRPGYEEFQVTDEVGSYVFFRGKILKVELRQIYFQVKNQVFTVQIGQSMAEARDYSFNRSWIDLEDEGLYDKLFEEKEMGKDKKDNKGKSTKKGSSNKTDR